MAVDLRFVLTGAKRVFDSRPMYAQVVVTDDCNLACSYCDEYSPGAPMIPIEELKRRIDKLDDLGVQVYDFLGGETLMHPDIAALVKHAKSKRRGSNLCTIITNGFLLNEKMIRDLNAAGLDFMQVSVDSLGPTPTSDKSLRSILPRLRVLAKEAKFTVEIQTVLNDETCATYDRFRETLKEFPFAFGFSIMHGKGGRIAVGGERFLNLLKKYGVFEGVNFYGEHLREMLAGDFSRPWKCLAGFKFLYVNSKGGAQWCAQQRDYMFPLEMMDRDHLRANNRHKRCEAGCSLGCARMVSHTLGEPLKSFGASVRLALGASRLPSAHIAGGTCGEDSFFKTSFRFREVFGRVVPAARSRLLKYPSVSAGTSRLFGRVVPAARSRLLKYPSVSAGMSENGKSNPTPHAENAESCAVLAEKGRLHA